MGVKRLRGELGLSLVRALGLGAELGLRGRRGGEGAELCQGEGFRPKAGLGIGRRFSYLS